MDKAEGRREKGKEKKFIVYGLWFIEWRMNGKRTNNEYTIFTIKYWTVGKRNWY